MSHTFFKFIVISMLGAVTCTGIPGTAVAAGGAEAGAARLTRPAPQEILVHFPQEGLRATTLVQPATDAIARLVFGDVTSLRGTLLPDPATPYARAVYDIGDTTGTLLILQYASPEMAHNAEKNSFSRLRSLYPKAEFKDWSRSGTATTGFMGSLSKKCFSALRRTGRVIAICPDARTPDEARRLLFRVKVDEESLVLKPDVRAFRNAKPMAEEPKDKSGAE